MSAQQQVPNVAVKTLKKQDVNMHDEIKKAKFTVISFWATWCSPCKRELNTIAEVYEDWQEEYDMQLIAVSIDDARNTAKVPGIVATSLWDYRVLLDESSALRNALNIMTIPRTMIVDQNGIIVYDHSGYKPGDEVELEDKLKALRQ